MTKDVEAYDSERREVASGVSGSGAAVVFAENDVETPVAFEPVLKPNVDLTCEEISNKSRLCHAPTVSVLMRVYRAAKFVGKALDRIFEQQTDFPFEVVVCDDCSPDDTVEVLRDYLQRFPEKMRILRATVNKGYLFTHERCHAYARGAWIAECDADDLWTNPLKLQKQYELVKAYNAVFCVTAFRTVNVRTGAEYASFRPKGTVLTRRELAAAYYQTSTHFYSKQTYDRMVAENRDWSGDFDDMSRQEMLSAYGRVVFLPDVSSTYFVGEGTYSRLNAEKKRMIYLRDHLSALVFAKNRAVRGAMGLGLLDAIYRDPIIMPCDQQSSEDDEHATRERQSMAMAWRVWARLQPDWVATLRMAKILFRYYQRRLFHRRVCQ